MISLYDAINVLPVNDNDVVYLCSRHGDNNALFMTIRQIKNKFDLRKLKVKKIYPNHWIHSEDNTWEIIIVL